MIFMLLTWRGGGKDSGDGWLRRRRRTHRSRY